MSLANMIRRMGEAGATPEAIAIAVEEIEGIQTMLDARRSADRDRKRAQRERQKIADVTGHSEDSHGTVTDKGSLDKESPQTPKKLNLPRDILIPARELDLPEGLGPDLWDQYRAMRSRIRKPLTPHAEQLALKHLRKFAEDGHPPGQIVEAAIVGSYQGLFAPTGKKNGHGKSEHKWGSTVAAADELIAELERADRDGFGPQEVGTGIPRASH